MRSKKVQVQCSCWLNVRIRRGLCWNINGVGTVGRCQCETVSERKKLSNFCCCCCFLCAFVCVHCVCVCVVCAFVCGVCVCVVCVRLCVVICVCVLCVCVLCVGLATLTFSFLLSQLFQDRRTPATHFKTLLRRSWGITRP